MQALSILTTGTAVLLLAACSGQSPTSPASTSSVKTQVVTAQVESIENQITVPGMTSRAQVAVLASRNGGQVSRVVAEAGDNVSKGELLMIVGADDARAGFARAHANLVSAEAAAREAATDAKRYNALFKEGAVSLRENQHIQRRHIAAQATAKSARAALAAAKTNLGYAEIRAPFSGLVAERNVQSGDYTTPGQPLIKVIGGDPQIIANVGEDIYRQLHSGMSANITADGHNYAARIIQLVAAADPVTHTHRIKLSLAKTATSPPYGSYAAVHLPLGLVRAVTIPVTAVTARAGITGVFVLDADNHAHFRPVRLAVSNTKTLAVIAAGLASGERIVAAPSSDLGNDTLIQPEATHD